MSNLLTPEAYASVQHRYRARYLMSLAIMLLASAIASFLALLPAYVVLNTERTALEHEASLLQQGASGEKAQHDRVIMSQARQMTAALADLGSGSRVAEAVASALAQKPKSASIEHVTYTHKDGEVVLVLSGTARSREDVVSYRDALRSNPLFKNVQVPIADLAGSGHFSITVNGAF